MLLMRWCEQPKLEDNEARWEFGSHETTNEEPVFGALPVTLVMPSISGARTIDSKQQDQA